MQPLIVNLFDVDEIPLDAFLMQEGHFDTRLKREIQKRRAAGEKGKIVPEFAEHIQFLQDWYTNEVIPLANWENQEGTAEQVYNAILSGWSKAVAQHGLSENEFATIKDRLDEVRREWADQPEPMIMVDRETGAQIDLPEDMLYAMVDLGPDAAIEKYGKGKLKEFSKEYDRVYPHMVGPHAFMSEKEHLAAVMGWWLTAGLVGSSRIGDRKPDFGGLRWINAPDTGGTAKGKAVGISAKPKGQPAGKTGGKSGASAPDLTGVPSIGSTGHGHLMRDPATGKPIPVPAARRRQPQQPGDSKTESIQQIANMLTEDVDDTWLDADIIMELAPAATPQQAAPAPQQALPTQPTVGATAQPDIEAAKKKGGELLAQLIGQLAIIKNDKTSWSKVKTDVIEKLKKVL